VKARSTGSLPLTIFSGAVVVMLANRAKSEVLNVNKWVIEWRCIAAKSRVPCDCCRFGPVFQVHHLGDDAYRQSATILNAPADQATESFRSQVDDPLVCLCIENAK
jgi:hypothetical protein